MPYKSEKIGIAGTKYDRRRKLTEDQKKEIVELYKQPEWSQRKLARKFNVSRRLITFILDPKKKERDLEMRRRRGGSKYYYRKKMWREQMRRHRSYKQSLYLKGDIHDGGEPEVSGD